MIEISLSNRLFKGKHKNKHILAVNLGIGVCANIITHTHAKRIVKLFNKELSKAAEDHFRRLDNRIQIIEVQPATEKELIRGKKFTRRTKGRISSGKVASGEVQTSRRKGHGKR